jgi:translation initiation factor IF-3
MRDNGSMRKNREIRISTVRLIGANGDQLGVVPTAEALRLAQEVGLDLVEVQPHAKPPVCKIIDYGKMLFDKKKSSGKAKEIKIKEIQLRPAIQENDLQTKIAKIKTILEDGDKANIVIRFSGREMAHTDLGFSLLERVFNELSSVAKYESRPVQDGRVIKAILAAK